MISTRRAALLCTGLLLAAPATSAAQPSAPGSARPIAVADYYRLVTVSAPALSPNGRQVVFARTRVIEAENRRVSELWIAPTDGSAPPSPLTPAGISATAPQISPDGRLLAYRSGSRIFFLDLTKPTQPGQMSGMTDLPVWSPDGKWMAFTMPTAPPPVAAPPKAESDRILDQRFTGRIIEWMNYRFDGRGYLTDSRDSIASPARELYIISGDGRVSRKLTQLGVDVLTPRWSPDGKRLVFVADTHLRDEYSYGRADLWTVAPDSAPKRLTDDGFDYSAPSWTADGHSLVFLRQESLNEVIARKQTSGGAVDLFRMSADGGPMANLTESFDLLPSAPVPSPDGRWIFFEAGIGGSTHLFRVPLQGGAVEQVTTGERRLAEFDYDAGFGRIVYTGAASDRPVELFTSRADGSEERRLTGFNDSLVAETAPVPARRLSFKSPDGTPIEGWILLPRTYSASGPAIPLILAMHGGPHGAYGNEFQHQFQLWAAAGYGVLYTNPRGSTGYGEKFLYGTWGGWGVLDYQDVMAGVDYALANFHIDPKRLGVTGYSYGGFLTDWIITQTPRFAAAVAGAGISNWVSDYGTADIPRTKESEFFGAPWEERSGEMLRRLSPISYAGKVVTPTLFIHGEADLRVPIEQAEQMYTALKKRRVPARFVRYPEMYHGGWTPWNTVHRYNQELLWWGKYLGPLQP